MMRGKKTTAIEPAEHIVKMLEKNGIQDISYGIIVSVHGRKDHRVSVKLSMISGCYLLNITTKRYKQEVRIYDQVAADTILNLLETELNENYRIIS